MAAKLTKRQKTYAGKVEAQKLYPIADALGLVKQCATAKFDESVDVCRATRYRRQEIGSVGSRRRRDARRYRENQARRRVYPGRQG